MSNHFSFKNGTVIFAAFFLFYHGKSYALNWTIQPSLTFQEVFSDNIKLSERNKQSALVTEVSPGISVNGRTPVSRFDLNYRMQSLYNAGGDSGFDINNQLQMNTNYQLLRNRLYLDSSSSISQQNISNRRTASDNISDNSNSTTVSTFRLSPYWTPHFQDFADGLLRLTYDRVSTDGGTNSFSKTNSFSQNVRLSSGRKFSYVNWTLAYNNRNQYNGNGNDVSFQDSSAEVSYAIGRKFNIFARVGQSSNSFASNSNSSQNGFFYTFGGQWRPNSRYRVQAGYGNNSFITVEISPFNRLRWTTTYRNNDIGLNTGDTWETVLNYNTRRSVWSISYNEQTQSTQQVLLDQQIFSVFDSFNQEQRNILENQGFRFNTSLPSLTDEVFVSKRATLSVSYRTGKSTFSGNFFRTIRDFEVSGNEEEVLGGTASWNWRFIRRMNSVLRASWQRTKSDGITTFSDNRYDISIAVRRNILARLNANIEYRYINQDSNDNLNNYTENRVSASLTYTY